MANSDFDRPVSADVRPSDRPETDLPVDSTAPPYTSSPMALSMPLGIVLALLFIGLVLYGLSA